VIVDRIEKFLRENKDPIPEALVADYHRMVGRSLQRQFVRRPHVPRGWRASMSWDCTRRLAYELGGHEPEPVEWNTSITFQQGDEREAMGVLWTRLAMPDRIVSPVVGGEQEEVSIVVDGQEITGHIDMVVLDDDGNQIPVDWKTTNGIGYAEAKDANTNPNSPWWTKQRFNYLSQLRTYIEAKKSPYGVFCYVNKEAAGIMEIHVKPDSAWRGELETRVRYLKKHIEVGEIPPRPAWATPAVLPGANLRADGSKGPVEELIRFPCGYCGVKKHCFPGFDVVPLTSGPKWRKPV
jgi:hypothetical protein